MTPAGHLAASYIMGSTWKKLSMTGLLIGSLLPDIDWIFVGFGWFNEIHRLVTHNLLFIIVSSILINFVFGHKRDVFLASGIFIGGVMHLVLDSILDNNPTNGIGTAIFWPFSRTCFSPFNLAFNSTFVQDGWNGKHIMDKVINMNLLVEMPLWILSLLFLFNSRKAAKDSQNSLYNKSI
jgi:membrane-bound metal-dependent hydrolase YbcI (DUF457 family)